MVEKSLSEHGITIILRPNCSATWYQSKLFLLVMMFPMFTIAIGWSLSGAWLVLPFAGLEFLLLSWVVYKVTFRAYQQDLIKIEPEQLIVLFSVNQKPPQKCIFPLNETHLDVKTASLPYDMSVLHLVYNRQRRELGSFLNKEDREDLRRMLVEEGVTECVDKWWQH